jgi:hypothetical protein
MRDVSAPASSIGVREKRWTRAEFGLVVNAVEWDAHRTRLCRRPGSRAHTDNGQP